MADNTQYVSVAGFVQFDPNEREANGKKVTEFFIKTLGGDGKNVRVTLWPEIQAEAPKKGDFVAVDGKYSTSTYQAQDGSSRTSYQVSAVYFSKLGEAATREDREVVANVTPGKDKKVPF
jgi:hypothetical protein